jgi:hypothetical protein
MPNGNDLDLAWPNSIDETVPLMPLAVDSLSQVRPSIFWNDTPDLWSEDKPLGQFIEPLNQALGCFKIPVFGDVLEDGL